MRVFRINQQTRNIYSRVVDENINFAESVQRDFYHVRNVFRVGDIRDDIFDFPTRLREIKTRLIRIHIANNNICAVIKESLSNCLTDAGSRARNYRSFAFETEPRAVRNLLINFINCEFVAGLNFGNGFCFDVQTAFENVTRTTVEFNCDVSQVHEIFLNFTADFDNFKFGVADFVNVARLNHVGEFVARVHNASVTKFGQSHRLFKHYNHLGGGDKIRNLSAEFNDFG